MKLAPIPLAFAASPKDAVRYAAESARTTHGAKQAADAARYFAGLVVGAVGGVPRAELLGGDAFEPLPDLWRSDPLHPEVMAVAAGSFREKNPPEIKGTGYVVLALEAALWAVHKSDEFEEAVLLAVNLGDDADSTGAICGQLAGAIYGIEAIPSEWRERVVMKEDIIGLAEALHAMAATDKVDE